MTVETCANCGEAIGKLEPAHVWREQVVCAACHARLSSPPPVPVLVYGGPTKPASSPTSPAAPQPDDALFYMLAEQKLAAEDRLEAERVRSSQVSVVRILGMFILLAGMPLTCISFPVGIPVMILGAVLVIAGR